MLANRPEDMPATFQTGFNTGDLDQVMALYEADAVLVPQPGQVVRGTDAIRQALLGFLPSSCPSISKGSECSSTATWRWCPAPGSWPGPDRTARLSTWAATPPKSCAASRTAP